MLPLTMRRKVPVKATKQTHDPLDLAWKRVFREAGWSIVIVVVLTSGLVAWILIPSVASSLEAGVSAYSNSVGTYVVVNTGGDRCVPAFGGCASLLPQNVTDAIARIPGVEKTYPIILNLTTLYARNSAGQVTMYEGETSALLGGPKGFPPSLLVLAAGRYPSNVPEFDINRAPSIQLNATEEVDIACQFCLHPAQSHGNVTDPFEAIAVGSLALNPLFVNVFVLWNSTFMLHKLGPTLYRQTWEGNGSNYIIVKVDNVANVPRVVNATEQLIQAPQYGLFTVVYNQALSQSLQSLTTQTAPLYELIGAVSLVAVAGVSFLVTQLIARKRDWETGVYLTQGWSWREVYVLYAAYFLFLSLISFAIAALLSALSSQYFTATYNVYGTFTTFTASVVPLYLLSGLAFAIALAFFASYIVIRRQRRVGLDNIVREY
jgi:hypothetical protein